MTVRQLIGLTSGFGKDLGREKALADLNALLAPLEAGLERAAEAQPSRPVVFVLGPPRCGTTLISQLLSQSGYFATISNFVAKFWEAPALGLRMARALGFGGETSDYRSTRGMTTSWSEPSEFGYFWSRYFDLGQPTHKLGADERVRFDRTGLQRAVAAMEAEVEAPLAFKNNTWFSLHADLLAELFPSAVLVNCRRDPYFAAQSLYLQRLDLYGDASRWWSVRPPEYDAIRKLSPIEQVAQQFLRIAAHTEASLARVRTARIIEVDYRRLTADPRTSVAEIATAAGVKLLEGVLERLPESFASTDAVRLDAPMATALRNAVEKGLAQ